MRRRTLVAHLAGVLMAMMLFGVPGARAQAVVITVGPNVNVSVAPGNQSETTVAINPTNSQQVFVASNQETNTAGLFVARSNDGGTTWSRGIVGTGSSGDGLPAACCDPSSSWDQFGNLFLVYLNQSATQVILLVSTDGGGTFTAVDRIDIHSDKSTTTSIRRIAIGRVDQPSVSTGVGSVWVTYRDGTLGRIFARGARVIGLGAVGPFHAPQAAPGSEGGNFGDIAIGPNGQVLVAYQKPSSGEGPATVFVNLDADGLGPSGFGAQVTATATNVGGFDFIPAQPDRSIDAEVGLAYDRSSSPRNGRVYLLYTDEIPNESNDTDIFVRFSDDNGGTWSAPVRVNDDATKNSQFNPHITLDQTTGNIGVVWHDARADGGTGPADEDGPNNDVQLWGTFSTNGGTSFLPNKRISAGTSDEDGADDPCCPDLDYGDYMGADFIGGQLHAAWADNSNSTGDNPDGTLNHFDIYSAKVTIEE